METGLLTIQKKHACKYVYLYEFIYVSVFHPSIYISGFYAASAVYLTVYRGQRGCLDMDFNVKLYESRRKDDVKNHANAILHVLHI